MLQLLHESPILTVSFDTDERWIYANWENVQSISDVQTGCVLILEHVQQTGSRRILNDNRQVFTLWAEAAEWVGRTYLQQLAAAGVQRLAWINAHSIYGRLSASQAIVYVEKPHAQLFDDYNEAVAWLRAPAD